MDLGHHDRKTVNPDALPHLPHQVKPTSLELHYLSQRPGLGAWMEGILTEAAHVYFDVELSMQLLRGREDGTCDHEVSEIEFEIEIELRRQHIYMMH